MNGLALLGILLVIYSIAVFFIALKKPEKVWSMAKIQMFIKLLGEQGTVIFFYIFSVICFGAGIWLIVK